MKTLNLKEMEVIEGGSIDVDKLGGAACGATVALLFSAAFAPLAFYTGAGCYAWGMSKLNF